MWSVEGEPHESLSLILPHSWQLNFSPTFCTHALTHPPTTLTGLFLRDLSSLHLLLYLPDVQHADVGPVPSFKEPRDPGSPA